MLFLMFGFIPKVSAEEISYPGKTWATVKPADVSMDVKLLRQARDYALKGGGSGMITRHGKVVLTWGDQSRRFDLKSTTKSIGVTALGLAIKDGKLKLDDPVNKHHPKFGIPPSSNNSTGWLPLITLRHLATQTAGFAKPGGYQKLLFKPGTHWHYSDGGPNWLAECVTLAYKRDVWDLMHERVFSPIGITKRDLTWRGNAYRPKQLNGIHRREFGSGIHANVPAMARIGYLYLHEGKWKNKEIIPESFVQLARTTDAKVVGVPEYEKRFGNASDHYGLLWWNNADGTIKNLPRDAYWSWGLYESLILVIPSLDIVAARAGKSWKRETNEHYDVLKPFFEPIAMSVSVQKGGTEQCSLNPEPLIKKIIWAPKSTIIRKAKGSDNWPLTWGDDDHLYTAYGDGWGFEPKRKGKLSMGFAKVVGDATNFRGLNVSAPTLETTGGGPSGKKASGILMVEGVLYLWARNADNSQLAWSKDRGKTWKWAKWKFTTSFGCPTFLNFGKNYSGARDNYVFTYSFDSDSAYKPADRMVLARVPKDKILKREAYEFYQGMRDGQPRWTKLVEKRGAVFERRGKCYRSGVSYHPILKRYLWVQLPGGDTRHKGGLSVYEASEPWGPWLEVFSTDNWDVGPGESASFPTKWMSKNGKTMYLVFSGDDCFSVRKATIVRR